VYVELVAIAQTAEFIMKRADRSGVGTCAVRRGRNRARGKTEQERGKKREVSKDECDGEQG
jgi:hypothetical protein